MTLSKTRWIVRWFFWSLGILDAFTDRSRRWVIEERGTNLCFFFQTTFVWVPLILVLHLVVYGALLTALTAGPIYLFGAGTYASVLGGIAVLVASIIGVGVLAGLWKDWRRERRREYRPLDTSPSSVGIVWTWLVAQKQKVCPMISFTHGARI